MVSFHEAEGMLQITISGVFDFEASRDLLLKHKQYSRQYPTDSINMSLESVTAYNSCAIGALILLADKAPGKLSITLSRCSKEVHQLFDVGLLDRYFRILPSVAK